MIFIDFHWFSLMFIDFHWSSLVLAQSGPRKVNGANFNLTAASVNMLPDNRSHSNPSCTNSPPPGRGAKLPPRVPWVSPTNLGGKEHKKYETTITGQRCSIGHQCFVINFDLQDFLPPYNKDDLFMSGLWVDYEWIMSEPRSKQIKDAENRRGNRWPFWDHDSIFRLKGQKRDGECTKASRMWKKGSNDRHTRGFRNWIFMGYKRLWVTLWVTRRHQLLWVTLKKNTVGADPAETRFMSNHSFEKKFYE